MLIETVLSSYIDLVARIIRRLRVKIGSDGISIELQAEAKRDVDERLALIDSARSNLLEGVRAIDELRTVAEKRKREVQEALAEVATLQRDKTSLEQQREALRSVIHADVEAFRVVAGVPSTAAIRRERFIGFLSGVLASSVASGVVWGLAQLISRFR
jgi:hypothetical protein